MAQTNESQEQVTVNVETLQPVTRTLMTIGALPTSYLISMTYEEQLLWLQNYLIKTVIPAINNNAEATKEVQDIVMALQDYINTQFSELNLQEYIDNKLDEMLESGVFENILMDYVQLTKVYDTYNDMISDASTFTNGMKLKTMGYHFINDGGGADYVVTNVQNENKYQVNIGTNLWVEMIIKDSVNVKQFGAYGDGENDDLGYINIALNFIKDNQVLYFPKGIYKISNVIEVNKKISIKGQGTIKLGGAGFNAITIKSNGCVIDGLSFINPDDYTPPTITAGNIGDAIRILANDCTIRNCNIENYIAGIVYGGVGVDYNKGLIENNNIKIKGLNTGYINDGICSLSDNIIIKNNIITNYDDVNNRGCIICDINALNNIVENNICLCNGVCAVGVHSEQSANTIIRGNNIYNPRLLGMTISTGSIVSKNYVETPHTEVSGYNLDHCAISLYGSPKNCIIDGNLINCFLDTKMAIRGNGNISGSKIINNSIYSTENHTPAAAIYLSLAEDTIIAKNSIMLTCTNGITINAKNNIISENIIKEATDKAIVVSAGINTLVVGNRILSALTGIEVFNATNSNIIGNIIGNEDSAITTGIITRNTGGNKFVNCSDNNFINVTTEYDRSTYGGLALVKDKNEIDIIDSTLNTRKKITIDNGSIVIS